MEPCDHTPPGATWPVCARVKGHVGRHASADYYWHHYGEAILKTDHDRLVERELGVLWYDDVKRATSG